MALLVLFTWPLIALIIAARVPRPAALVWMVFLPYMFLPERYALDLPGLPPFDKYTVIAGALVLAFAIIHPPGYDPRTARLTEDKPEELRVWLKRLLWLSVAAMFVGAVFTVQQNSTPIRMISHTIPGTRSRDLLSFIVENVAMLTPFFLAVRYLKTAEDRQMLLRTCVTAGLIYTLFMLVELRLSPQFHNWLYGYHQHSFAQHIRGGYRPKVFMSHGLQVGFFMVTALLAALALWKETRKSKWLWAAIWLTLMLLASRNLGAAMIAFVMAGFLVLNLRKWTRLMVIAVCLLMMTYPAVRVSSLSPTTLVLDLVSRADEGRAQSFAFRLFHEDALLQKAMERPMFGWGLWGRNRVYDEFGNDISVTDSRWIQQIGEWGWVGYVSFFMILCLPLLAVAWPQRGRPMTPILTGMLVIAAGNLLYIIPNSVVSPVSWLIFGALFGYALSRDPEATPAQAPETTQARHSRSNFSRFPVKTRQNG